MSDLSDRADNPDAGAAKGKIYIDQNARNYKVLGEKGDMCQGTLPDEIDLSQLSLNADHRLLKNQVLSYTSKQGHTRYHKVVLN